MTYMSIPVQSNPTDLSVFPFSLSAPSNDPEPEGGERKKEAGEMFLLPQLLVSPYKA